MIVTGAHRSRIAPAFQGVVQRAIELTLAMDDSPSLYLYGSVATGLARIAESDVDLLSIGLDAASANAMSERLSREFSGLCRAVEVAAGQSSGYEGSGDEAYGNRVFLRHYCVHLSGPDPRSALPEFRADRAAARGFNGDIDAYARRWLGELCDSEELGALARRIARKTLLAVAGLVSVHDGTWTTDRLAARRWGDIVPELAGPLEALMLWSREPALDLSRDEVHGVVTGVVRNVVEAFRVQIGLWNEPQASEPS